MSPLIWTTLITSLTTSTIIIMISHHWLLAWLSLELNTLSILPIIMRSNHPRTTEAATKYFLIQTTAATLILLASTINAWQTGFWSIMQSSSPIATTIITVAIMMKLAIAPAHLWYPEILQGTTMTTALIISTWQKIAPLTLLYLLINHLSTNTMLLLGLLSALLGGWTGLNQTQTRKILAFSSISHMGWMITALCLNPSLATLTMITYMTMTTTMFLSLTTSLSKTLLDLGTSWTHSPILLTITMLTLLSLAGLPPLTGFMPKLLILKELVTMKLLAISTTLALTSLPNLAFYTRMAYLTTLTTPPNTTNSEYKWRFKSPISPLIPTTALLTTLTLPMTSMLYLIT
uniref:NADH-ubiquinone oxidoreductase chain 2 n=2 Tax=Heteronotia TaxID=13084 RepID=V5N949_9SAUR|nr:NADH dehydrogenase subunit 2 [Heteronotia fasciolata]ALV88322.1 NADH dehydrogenase subunit 2 [Heteronotia binoei]AHA84421.1 NADH dehydrogenase subunit 2 [Heteronotia fasciolata]AHA84423.1 NADH dehydrogenase subunit 2 [Heteronotia fasciolata]AHA84425.1 NADH dehydrogenase subunit 2 [Heteronotia fasciolata]